MLTERRTALMRLLKAGQVSSRQPRSRFARRVVVVGIAAFSALAAVVGTERGEALDRAIAKRVQANKDPRI